jgi:predicted DNA-binding transcriptional regulator AlpA
MKPITHHLTEAQIARLRAVAKKTGLSVAELIRRAVDTALPKFERDANKEK